LLKVGGFLNDTLTEDAELTVRVQSLGYKTVFSPGAIAYTEAPNNTNDFIKQRFRWTFGTLQVLFKYRRLLLKKNYGLLFFLILPFISLVQFPFMILAPFVDLMAVLTALINTKLVLTYFLYFLVVAYFFNISAFLIAKEKRIWLLLLLPISRIYYQFLWYFILYKSVASALRGRVYPWNKIQHDGSVNLNYSE
ncbi:MAG: glycosyltransferase family 2 protein, partial [Nanoarchaeota archaeon]